MANATLTLTPEQIEYFQQNGYLSLPVITTPEEVAGLREVYDRLFATQAGRAQGDHAIRKAPHTEAPTPWHQDEANWDPNLDYSELSIWIPLQEATLENGCMQFVPGTHRQEVLPHHPIGNDPRIIGLEVDDPEARAAGGAACPLPAGGATVHHSRTLHYTGPNNSDGPRRAYILTFGTPRQTRATPRRFYWQEQQQTRWQERHAAAKASAPGSDGA